MAAEDILQRVARLEERDVARSRETEDFKAALKDNTAATNKLNDTIQKMQVAAAYDKGKERVVSGTVGSAGGFLLSVIANWLMHR